MENITELRYKNKESFIDKFQNGRERYSKSPTLNYVINSLSRGDDPITLIDQLIDMYDKSQEQLCQTILRSVNS